MKTRGSPKQTKKTGYGNDHLVDTSLFAPVADGWRQCESPHASVLGSDVNRTRSRRLHKMLSRSEKGTARGELNGCYSKVAHFSSRCQGRTYKGWSFLQDWRVPSDSAVDMRCCSFVRAMQQQISMVQYKNSLERGASGRGYEV